jgi:hypothetical protein
VSLAAFGGVFGVFGVFGGVFGVFGGVFRTHTALTGAERVLKERITQTTDVESGHHRWRLRKSLLIR